MIHSQNTEKSICDGKETTNAGTRFLESQQLLVGLFRLIPMAFLGFILHRISLLNIINPLYSTGPSTRLSLQQSFPSCHGLEPSCEHKHWLNPAQHRKGRGAFELGCAALLTAVASSDKWIYETVVRKTCKNHCVSCAELSVCEACAP